MVQSNRTLEQILNNWIAGETPKEVEYQQLATEALADKSRAKAFGITPLNVEKIIQEAIFFKLLLLKFSPYRLLILPQLSSKRSSVFGISGFP